MIANELRGIAGLTVEEHASSGPLCTYRTGGPIAVLVRIETEEALSAALAVVAEANVEVLSIGKGSNLLIADAGFDGVCIVLGDSFSEVTIDGTIVRAGAAASLPVVARASVKAGLVGFEWAVGVPGSIGGAVRMNAGGHGSDMAASLVSVDVADLSTGVVATRGVESLQLNYRSSILSNNELVVSATLQLIHGDAATGAQELKDIVSWRREHQPGGANAGSVFTNPPGDSAGRLIDAAGLKGHRVGTAEVSTKHANFIQVDADGSADDVMALMSEIVDRVHEHAGVRLHAETRLIGFAKIRVDHVQGHDLTVQGDDVHG